MPELPEVEILARHLRPLLHGRTIQAVEIRRAAVLAPTSAARFQQRLRGAKFLGLARRGKYLLFELRAKNSRAKFTLLGHLGMTGRMFLARKNAALPKHAAVVLHLGAKIFIYDDPRYFGRLTLDCSPVKRLGPEPLAETFTPELLARELKRSRQPVKVKLLDQSLVAGIGNIYASESLFRAGLSPRRAANRLTRAQVEKLWRAIREVLAAAIKGGSTIPLNFSVHDSDGLFYYGRAAGTGNSPSHSRSKPSNGSAGLPPRLDGACLKRAGSETGAPVHREDFYTEQLRVYDRAGQPCVDCQTPIKRIVLAARSTFFCPRCQKS